MTVRRDAVDAHLVVAMPVAQGSGQAHDAGLGRAVRGPVPGAEAKAAVSRHVHDGTPALSQYVKRLPRDLQGAQQVHAGDARPVLQRIVVQPRSGDVEHQVQSAVLAHGPVDQFAHLLPGATSQRCASAAPPAPRMLAATSPASA